MTGMDDWRRQYDSRITSPGDLAEYLGIPCPSSGCFAASRMFPMAVTPYYASLIRFPVETDPVFLQCMPSGYELHNPPWLTEDPLGEVPCSIADRLVHRYRDRALIIATSECASYCRHCTRKRVSSRTAPHITERELDECAKYLKHHPEIDDVLVSGGDPLLLEDDVICMILERIRSVASVKAIRIATRAPVTIPMRITAELVSALSGFKPIYVNTHFNHVNELTDCAIEACSKLVDAGIPVANQTVLLRGVNDTAGAIEALCRKLFHNRIRPYYLFQCDLVRGVEHFRTPLDTGLDIMRNLRGRLSGMAIPNFAVDFPGKSGKIELLPQYIAERTGDRTVFTGNNGETVSYPEPETGWTSCSGMFEEQG